MRKESRGEYFYKGRKGIEGVDGLEERLSAIEGSVETLVSALDTDILMVIAPATATKPAGSTGWTQAVTVTFTNTAGETHTWLNDALAVSVGDTSTAGTASVSSATPAITAGVATFNLIGDAAAWVAAETATATVAAKTVLGKSVTGGTCVVTIA